MLDPQTLIGKQLVFDYNGRRLCGVVTEAVSAGRNPRGNIPDLSLSVRGASGKVIRLASAVDAYVQVKD